MSNTGTNFIKAVIWLAVAGFFGIMPFISLKVINKLSEVNVSAREIDQLVEVAFIVFPCCAITGAVVADFIASKIKIKNTLAFMAVYLLPFAMIFYLFSEYLALYIQYEDLHAFGPGSRAVKGIVAFTVIYALAAKTYYYRRRNLTAKSTSSAIPITGATK
jgi:hypothetical protein